MYFIKMISPIDIELEKILEEMISESNDEKLKDMPFKGKYILN